MGIIKSALGLFSSIFGFDKLAKSDEGQSVQDAINDIGFNFSNKPIFQTKKVKEKAEKEAKQQEREAIKRTAENTQKIAEELARLNERLSR